MSARSEGAAEVLDQRERHRLLIVDDGYEAELVYRNRSDDRLELVHTGVPEELGGRGLGAQLVLAAVAKAKAAGATIIPTCSYARKWLRDHPDVAATVPIDWPA